MLTEDNWTIDYLSAQMADKLGIGTIKLKEISLCDN